VNTERRGRVAIVELNRPEARNAINLEITLELSDTFDELEGDDSVWAVVITGAGDAAFCAGADLKAASRNIGSTASPPPRLPRGGFAAITDRFFPKPLVAAVNGWALGGGCEIILACDLAVVEEHAMIGLTEVKWGIVAAAGGIVRLSRRIPLPLALEMTMLAEPISAQRAYDIGLVNRVVPKGESTTEAVVLAERICEKAPLAVRLSKRMLREAVSLDEDEMWRRQEQYLRDLRDSSDRVEGITAFAEKRKPAWQAR
jgi:enoyl-CoA hydratase/carnithine racemase